MKYTTIITAILSITAIAQTETSQLSVEEVFSVETSEELEASLADGYPMPWLAEILEDETIPEEDRYWLDCRIRALIAQEFHLFFDRNGNAIEIEADKIRYGEFYWQEHFVIDPLGELPRGEQNPETGLWGESGFVYNRFGEKTGELALIGTSINLSRDGSIGLLAHWDSAQEPEFGTGYLYFLYSDGSYHMHPELLILYGHTLSQSGDYALVKQDLDELDPIQLFNREGEVLWEQNTAGFARASVNPMISPDDKYCLVPSTNRRPWINFCQMIDIYDGTVINTFIPKHSSRISYSANGNFFFSGEDCISHLSESPIWSLSENRISDFRLKGQHCSQNGEYFAIVLEEEHGRGTYFLLFNANNELLLKEPVNFGDLIHLSPNGSFTLTSPGRFGQIPMPFKIWQIGGDQ